MKYPEVTIETVDMLTPLADQIVRFHRTLLEGGVSELLTNELTRMALTSYLEAWSKPLTIAHPPSTIDEMKRVFSR